MNNKDLASKIIENVGGEENINSVVHCMTRLRFKLVNVDKANKEKLESIDGVQAVRYQGGQYKVVIGSIISVGDVSYFQIVFM